MFALLGRERMTSSKSRRKSPPDSATKRPTPETKQLRRLTRRELTLKDGRYLLLYESKSQPDEHA
jgi:hypothetical protein